MANGPANKLQATQLTTNSLFAVPNTSLRVIFI